MAEENGGEPSPPMPPREEEARKDEGDRDRDRDRHRDRDGDRDRDRKDRERERDRDKDRDRKHGRRSRSRSRSRDKKSSRRRSRSRSRSRDRKSRRRRSRSRSRSRRRSYSRSRSRSPRRRRRTGFDQAPAGGLAAAPAATGFGAAPAAAAALPGLAAAGLAGLGGAAGLAGLAAVPGLAGLAGLPGAANAAAGLAGLQVAGLLPALAGAAQPSQQATRHARRIYVGGLPVTSTDDSVAQFFNDALTAVGGLAQGAESGLPVVNVYLNAEKRFAFVEFRTVEETSNAMALDGIMFDGVSVRVRRPNDYNPALAVNLGPAGPSPNLNLAAIGLTPGGAAAQAAPTVQEQRDRVFIGGLPYYLTEEQVKELMGSFGAIKTFTLVKDKDTGTSKGYGFCEYEDPSVTDIACTGMHGMKMGDRTLTVRRANSSVQTGANRAPLGAGMGETLPGPPPMGVPGAGMPGIPTRVLVLEHAVTPEELASDEEYNDIIEDMREEGGKYGVVHNIIIPRPAPPGMPPPMGLGKVIMEYAEPGQAAAARNAMHGRKFGGRVVIGTFLSDEAYQQGRFDGP